MWLPNEPTKWAQPGKTPHGAATGLMGVGMGIETTERPNAAQLAACARFRHVWMLAGVHVGGVRKGPEEKSKKYLTNQAKPCIVRT